MQWIAALAGSAALALAPAPTVAPPPGPGVWHQLGAAVASRLGKALHFYRTAQDPLALGIVVTSTSPGAIHGFWASDCEVLDDDTMEEQHQGPLDGAKRVVVYPPVLAGATNCYLWVNVGARRGATVTAAEFTR